MVARRRLVASVFAAALIGGPSALAATPGTPVAGYGGQGGQAQGALGAEQQQQGGVLPFTGAQLGLLAIGGAVLLGSGVALRRSTRPDA
ncbi:MAG: hypothetical protein ACM33B_09315 [Pseudomonadota bacterium]